MVSNPVKFRLMFLLGMKKTENVGLEINSQIISVSDKVKLLGNIINIKLGNINK